MKNFGYTLMELLVVVTILVGLMVAGTSLFLTNLRSGGTNEILMQTSRSARNLAETIERKLRFSEILRVENEDRESCLLAGSTGVTGQSLLFENLDGTKELLKLEGTRIASASAEEVTIGYLTDVDTEVKDFKFSWFCQSGINDKIILEMSLDGVGLEIDSSEVVRREINLLNSGSR